MKKEKKKQTNRSSDVVFLNFAGNHRFGLFDWLDSMNEWHTPPTEEHLINTAVDPLDYIRQLLLSFKRETRATRSWICKR